MLQDGTGSQNIRGVANYYMWVQNLGSSLDCGEEQLGGLVEFHNGDLIYSADVTSTTSNTSTVFLQDQTIGDYYSGPVPLSGHGNNGPYTGSSACIVEQNGASDILPNFGTVDFQWCRAYVNVNGTTSLYSMMHLPGNAQLFRHHDVNTLNNPQYPANYCAYAELPNNPTNPTYPDSSFNVDYIQGCA